MASLELKWFKPNEEDFDEHMLRTLEAKSQAIRYSLRSGDTVEETTEENDR